MDKIKIERYPVINCEDVEKLTGKHWGDFEFAQMAENGSYHMVRCSDEALQELEFDIKWARREEPEYDEDDEEILQYLKRSTPLARYQNQKQLIEILRNEYGITDGILIHVDW